MPQKDKSSSFKMESTKVTLALTLTLILVNKHFHNTGFKFSDFFAVLIPICFATYGTICSLPQKFLYSSFFWKVFGKSEYLLQKDCL